MKNLDDMLAKWKLEAEKDAEAYKALDDKLCMLCGAYGEDKRTLRCRYFYDLKEMVPEMLFLKAEDSFFLRTCKSCRGALLQRLAEWRDERVALRPEPKDHDGYLADAPQDPEATIPIRKNGVLVNITQEEWDERQKQKSNISPTA